VRASIPRAGFQMVGDVGAITGPPIAGMIIERTCYFTAFATTAAIAVSPFSIAGCSRNGVDSAAT